MDKRNVLKQFLKRLTISVIWMLAGTLFVLSILFAGWLIFGSVVGAVLFPLGLIILAIGLFFFAYFYLAKKNYWFTFVREGTAKIVVKGDAFSKALIQWTGFSLDDEQNVVPENEWFLNGKVIAEGTPGAKRYKEPWRPFGGFRYYGFWPIKDILVHTLRWHDIQKTEKGEAPQFHEKDLDYILLQPDVYWTKMSKVETGYLREESGGERMERVPVDVEFLIRMRVVNPFKAIYKAPIGYVENALFVLSPLLRAIITSRDYDSLLRLKGRGKEIWEGLGEEMVLIQKLRDEWGIGVDEEGIQSRDVIPPAEIQKAGQRERQMELEARGIAASSAGAVIAMMASARGKKTGEIRAEIDSDPEMKKEFLSFSKDYIFRKLGIDGGARVDIGVEGAEGIERAVLNGLAAFLRMPQGKGKKSKAPFGKGEKREEGEEKEKEDEGD